MTLEIPVWQFVRIMVALEDAKAKHGVYENWSAAWSEVDRELERLRTQDPEGFAELMMEQQVVLEIADETSRSEVVAALGRVIGEMERALGDTATAGQHRDDLSFECTELRRLRDSLGAPTSN